MLGHYSPDEQKMIDISLNQFKDKSETEREAEVIRCMQFGLRKIDEQNYEVAKAAYDLAHLFLSSTQADDNDTFFRMGICRMRYAQCYDKLARLAKTAARNVLWEIAVTHYEGARRCFNCEEPKSNPTDSQKQYYQEYQLLDINSKPSALNKFHYLAEINSRLAAIYLKHYKKSAEKSLFYARKEAKARKQILSYFPGNIYFECQHAESMAEVKILEEKLCVRENANAPAKKFKIATPAPALPFPGSMFYSPPQSPLDMPADSPPMLTLLTSSYTKK